MLNSMNKVSWRNAVKNIYVFGILAGFIVVFSIISPKFISPNNIAYIIQSVSPLLIVSVAATMLMISGNIDLSVGSIVAFTGVIVATLSKNGTAMLPAIVVGLLVGLGIGWLNGLLVVKLRITPVIATLATTNIFLGLGKILCGDSIPYVKGVGDDFSFIGRGKIEGIPAQFFVIIVVVVLFIILQKKSILGKYTIAIGGNADAARLAGINVNKIVWIMYILVGLFAALGGCIKASNMGVADATSGQGFELDVITAILMGGTSFAGGEGSVGRTIAGAFIVTILGIALNMANVPSFYQYVVKGGVLILAVWLDKIVKEKINA